MTLENGRNVSTSDRAKFIAKIGALYSGVVALISDILQPLLDFTLVFLCLCGLLLISEILLGFYTKSARGRALNEKLLKLTDGYWFRTILSATALSFCVLLGMFLLNDDTEDGFLAEKSAAVRKLQESLGVINTHLDNIGRNAEIASKNTRDSSRNLSRAARESRNQAELLRELSESSDARKRLAQQGLRFDSRHFAFAIQDGDLESQKLFYEAGMRPDAHDSQGGMPIFAAIINEAPAWRDSLRLAINEGGFDANKPRRVSLGTSLDPGIYEARLTRRLGGSSDLLAFFQPDLPEGGRDLDAGCFIALSEISPTPETLRLIEDTGLDLKKGAALRERLADQYESYVNELANDLSRLWICETSRQEIANPRPWKKDEYITVNGKLVYAQREVYDPEFEAFAKSIKKAISEPLELGAAVRKTAGWCPQEFFIDGFLYFRKGFMTRNFGADSDVNLGEGLRNIQLFRKKIEELDISGFKKRLAEYRAGTKALLNASKKPKQGMEVNVR